MSKITQTPSIERHFPVITGTIITDHDGVSHHRDMTASFLNYLKNEIVNEGESTITDAVQSLNASDCSDAFYYSLPVRLMPDAPQGFRVEIEEEAKAALTGFFDMDESGVITLEMAEQAISAFEAQLARETITFHLPCDNQAKDNDHEANLTIVLNKQDFDRFSHMKDVARKIGLASIQVAPETEEGCALSIDLTGVTFDSTESPLYSSTFGLAVNDQIEVQAYGGYDEIGKYVSYDGIKLTDLKNAYSHAVERGAKHVTIDAHSMEAHFTLEQPEVLTEQSLCDYFGIVIDEPLGEPLDLSGEQERISIKANLNIVYDLAAVFESEESEDDVRKYVRKQIEHYLKAGVEQMIGCGMATGVQPVYLDDHSVQVDISETLTGLDEKTLHCNLILDACFSIAEPDCQPLSCYADELSENLESIFARMSAEGMMSSFSDTLIVDDWKVTIDHGQAEPRKLVQRDEMSM